MSPVLSLLSTFFFFLHFLPLLLRLFLPYLSRLSLQVSAVCLAFLSSFISFDNVSIFSCFSALFSLYNSSLATNKQKKINCFSKSKKKNRNEMINSCFRFRCAIVQAVTSSSSGPSFCFPSSLSCKFLRPAAPPPFCQQKIVVLPKLFCASHFFV